MQDGVRFATTEEELKASYQLRYKVYVEGMGRLKDKGDHALKELKDEYDDNARAIIAIKGGEAVGTLRLFWGGDKPFTQSLIEAYDLSPLLINLEQAHIIILERLMVDEKHRGSSATLRMYKEIVRFIIENKIEAVLLDSEPHLLNSYLKLGFRPFAKTYSYPGIGLVIPLLLIWGDYEHLQKVGSPFVLWANEKEFRCCRYVNELLELVGGRTTVVSQSALDPADFIRQVYVDKRLWEDGNPKIFDGLSDDEIARVIEKSHIIDCKKEDHIIEKNNAAKTMFVVLSGMVEVYRSKELLTVIPPGGVIGEVAFFLQRPRSATIIAATADVRLLSLDEPSMSRLLKYEPELANKILSNLCRVLCSRLIGGVETSDLRSS